MKKLGILIIGALCSLGIVAAPAADGAGVATLLTHLPDCDTGLIFYPIRVPPCTHATYIDVTGLANNIAATGTPEHLTISDPGVLILPVSRPDALCDFEVGSAECANVDVVEILAGNGNDRITMKDIVGRVEAGAGNDTVDASGSNFPAIYDVPGAMILGGAGKDTLSVHGPVFEFAGLFGEDGNDRLTARGPSLETVFVAGGPGDDTITLDVPDTAEVFISCGTGFDRVFGAPAGAVIGDGNGSGRCEVVS